MIKLLILDFDGTLADSKTLTYKVIKEEVENAGHSLSKGFEKKMGTSPLVILLKKERLILDIEDIAKKIALSLFSKASNYKLVNLSSLRKIKIEKVIISNNLERIIREVLKKSSISFIKEIHGYEKGLTKEKIIKGILKAKRLKPEEVLCVGDRETDVYAAKKSGCYSAAVSNKISWAPRRVLSKSKPDFLIHNLKDLPEIIEKLNSL